MNALSFLTIIPIKCTAKAQDIQSAVSFFPVVGFLEGLFLFFTVYVFKHFFSPLFLSALMLFLLFLVRGIFHMDGLSDTCDALFYKGTGDIEQDRIRRLEIMKDSTVGVGGVSALVLVLLLKLCLFYEIILSSKTLLLLPIFTFSRWLIIPVMRFSRPAKKTGLGALLVGSVDNRKLFYSSIFPTLLLLYFSINEFPFLPLSLFFTLLFIFFLKKLFEERFGGITGDNLGATIELTEIILPFSYLLLERLWQSI